MSKLFGKTTSPTTPAPNDPAKDPNLIRVFDKYGKELFITKDEWRRNVLPGAIQSHWNQPDELYGVIINAIQDGLHQDVLNAARQLYSIDPNRVRATSAYAFLLIKDGQLDDAGRILQSYLDQNGEDALVLMNLARLYEERKQTQKSEETLWRAVEIDPNHDNGLLWYASIQEERGGKAARINALKRIAALPGSWR
ncbi:MAG: hypothetical protein C5B55_11660, partial [Blastocatellia bacterium]